MLVSCKHCGRTHQRGHICEKRALRKKDNSALAVRFRNTSTWKKKSEEVRKRDNFLCQVCILEKRYVFDKIEVHHIETIEKAYSKRLDNLNLITLCAPCHKEADAKKISAKFLQGLAAKQEKKADAF